MIKLELPWPPSVNRLYRATSRNSGKPGVYEIDKAKEYKKEVFVLIKNKKLEGFGSARVEVDIKAYPPDRYRRDLDNILKAIIDSLEKAGVYKNDSQIDRIQIERKQVVPGGSVLIEIKERKNG